MEMYKRTLTFEIDENNTETRTMTFSVSSETPIYNSKIKMAEVLLHDSNYLNTSRLENGASVLWNHNRDKVLGVVESFAIVDKKLYVSVRFKDCEEYHDIQDKILRNVSIGYFTYQHDIQNEIAYAKKWEIFEVSIVSIPADISVGVGRELENKVAHETEQTNNRETVINIKGDIKMDRKEEILALAKRFNINNVEWATENDTVTVDAFRQFVLTQVENKTNALEVANIATGKREEQTYSVANAINMLSNGRMEGYEFERSNEVASKTNRAARGIYIPLDESFRSGEVTKNAASGGKLIGTVHKSESYIDALYNASIASRLGVDMISNATANLTFPKASTVASVEWVSEVTAPTKSQPTFGSYTLSPKYLAGYVDISKDLLAVNAPAADYLIKKQLISAASTAIDYALLHGSGSAAMPTGILGLSSGVNVTTVTSGSVFNYASALDMLGKIASDNVTGDIAFVMNPSAYYTLSGRVIESGYPSFVLDTNSRIAGNLAIHSSTVEDGYIFAGKWNEAQIAMFGGIDLTIDPYSAATSGVLRIVYRMGVDIGFRYNQAFAYCSTFA